MDRLRKCLLRIKGADEIIVSDDSQGPETRELISTHFEDAIWVQGPQKGPAANRNNGAHAASGDWFVFIDDDCLASEQWLREIRDAATKCEIVEGKTICPDKMNHPLEDLFPMAGASPTFAGQKGSR